MDPVQPLIAGFLQSYKHFPDRAALEVAGRTYTYAELFNRMGRIALQLIENTDSKNSLVGVLAYRSLTAYSGILGILSSGHAYIPLNPKFPSERSRKMLMLSGAKAIVVGNECIDSFSDLLRDFKERLVILLPDTDYRSDLINLFPQHQWIFSPSIEEAMDLRTLSNVVPNSTAYVLFTSGSTGDPKGVTITQANVKAYVRYISNRFSINEADRFSQLSDLTFDPSVHDMFVCWENGACLCVVPENSVMGPAEFIKEKKLTIWYSVPSVLGFMSRLRMLKPGAFPTIRVSLFCGEPLPSVLIQQWQEAVPNSVCENLYGPTEATISMAGFPWDRETSPGRCVNGIVPCGWPFADQAVAVVNDSLQPIEQGEIGELLLGGTQVMAGYWGDPEKTANKLVRIKELSDGLWYRTGDRVKQDVDGCLLFIGRMDNQVKIRGYRVELQEIEAVLNSLAGAGCAAAVPWPVSHGNAEGVVAFVSTQVESRWSENDFIERCRKRLPDYMVPRKIYWQNELPLNSNGKIDRPKLVQFLKDRA